MQPEGYRHDYSAIETRLGQLQAPADRQRMIGQGLRALAVSGALCAVLISAGTAWRIAKDPKIETVVEEKIVETTVPARPPLPPVPEAEVAAGNGVVTTNFTLFREKLVEIDDRTFAVTAGHKYLTETDTEFSSAWCYTGQVVDGVHVRADLGELESRSQPVKLRASEATLDAMGLTSAEHERLFKQCPWLSGNPNLASSSGATYRFASEVTRDSVDQLIAAVDAGAETVRLESPGGRLDEGMRGYRALVEAGVDTVAVGPCASACALLFLGGQSRSVDARGAIGVHQWKSVEGEASEAEAQLTSASLVQLVADAGVSEEFFVAGARTPAHDIRFLTEEELRAWGVVRPGSGS